MDGKSRKDRGMSKGTMKDCVVSKVTTTSHNRNGVMSKGHDDQS